MWWLIELEIIFYLSGSSIETRHSMTFDKILNNSKFHFETKNSNAHFGDIFWWLNVWIRKSAVLLYSCSFNIGKEDNRLNMSSLLKNSTVSLDGVSKRKASFSRSDSLDKLQYTALFSLQLAGKLKTNKKMSKKPLLFLKHNSM